MIAALILAATAASVYTIRLLTAIDHERATSAAVAMLLAVASAGAFLGALF